MEGLTPGRIVHYVFTNREGELVHRPAIIVRVWNDGGVVNMIYFPDGTNDLAHVEDFEAWQTNIRYSEIPEPNTWHWIEKA